MKKISNEKITFDQAVDIILDGGIPDIQSFGFSFDETRERQDRHRGSFGPSRTQKEYEYCHEETLIHIALSSENSAAVLALIDHLPHDIFYVQHRRTRARAFKDHASGPLITDSDCHEWGEWGDWKETKESLVEYAQNLDTPPDIVQRLQQKLTLLALEEDALADAFQKVAVDPYKENIVRARIAKGGREVSLYGFPNKTRAEQIEYRWQQEVTHRFFRVGMPLDHSKSSFQIYTLIKNHVDNKLTTPIQVDGFSRRSFIIALSKIMSEEGHMPELIFGLGITRIKLTRETAYSTKQKGNFSMQLVPKLQYDIAYGEGLERRLENFTRPKWDVGGASFAARQEKFLELIDSRLTHLTPFTYRDLNKYQNIKISRDTATADASDERTSNNLHLLNALVFLVTTVEVLVRLYRTEGGEIYQYPDLSIGYRRKAKQSDAFPVAMAQARSLFLLLHGDISFADFWGASQRAGYDSTQHRAYYGAVTGKGTIDYLDIVMEKMSAINRLYDDVISSSSGWLEFKNEFKKSNAEGGIIEGRSRMYFDLKKGYGSGHESDSGDDYSDTEDAELGDVVAYGACVK